jgi:hypothetical protein
MLSSIQLSLVSVLLLAGSLVTAVPPPGAQLANVAEWTVDKISHIGNTDSPVHSNTVWEFIDCGKC